MTYQELQGALQVFGFTDRASLKEIKSRHRQLAKLHHPDGGQGDAKAMGQVNAAYQLLLDYVTDYRFSFTESEFYEQNPEERLRRQFMEDPLWGSR